MKPTLEDTQRSISAHEKALLEAGHGEALVRALRGTPGQPDEFGIRRADHGDRKAYLAHLKREASDLGVEVRA